MRKVAIVTDSSANLPAELAERYLIFVVPLLVSVNGCTYRDGIDLSPADVYQYMLQHEDGELPTTSAPSPDEFVRAYAAGGEEADEIVSIHLSSDLSSTYQVARVARDLVDTHIHVLDSRNVTMSCGFAVLEAARLAETGATADEVVQRANEVAASARFLVTLDRFDYLHRGGRVPAIAVLAGSVLKICPILVIEDGLVKIAGVTRTRPRAIERILQSLERDTAGRPAHVAVMHAAAPSEAEGLLDEVTQRVPCIESFITEFTPVMGVHTGPGLLGVAYYTESNGSEP